MVSSQINDGKWTSRQLVTARLKENNADYSFSKDTVTIQTIINENGSVEGFCGGAKLKDCSISENRGWFGRLFNLYTDYIITGKLIGSVFEKDTLNDKKISCRFNLKETFIDGTLFQKQAMDVFPMVNYHLSNN
jgi:hypothetical protein